MLELVPRPRVQHLALNLHGYIEEQRKLLRAQTIDLAAQERDQALELLDNAIEKVVPHINGDITIETVSTGAPTSQPSP